MVTFDRPHMITFRTRCSRGGEMYIGHGRLCVRLCVIVSVCLCLAEFPHYCTDPGVTRGMVGVPSSCALWADLQSVHGFRCYDKIHVCKLMALFTANANSTKREMSSSACTRCVAGLSFVFHYNSVSISNRPIPGHILHTGATVHLWRATVHP